MEHASSPYAACNCRFRIVVYPGGSTSVGRVRCLKRVPPSEAGLFCPMRSQLTPADDLGDDDALFGPSPFEGPCSEAELNEVSAVYYGPSADRPNCGFDVAHMSGLFDDDDHLHALVPLPDEWHEAASDTGGFHVWATAMVEGDTVAIRVLLVDYVDGEILIDSGLELITSSPSKDFTREDDDRLTALIKLATPAMSLDG